MKPGDLVTEPRSSGRKVLLVVGFTRTGKVKVCVWSQNGQSWSLPQSRHESRLSPAPEDWPQTKEVKRWLAQRGVNAGIYVARLGRGKERSP